MTPLGIPTPDPRTARTARALQRILGSNTFDGAGLDMRPAVEADDLDGEFTPPLTVAPGAPATLADDRPAVGPQVPADAPPMPVRPDFGALTAPAVEARPEAHDTREARLIQTATALLGGAATVAAGPSAGGVFGGISAVLGGTAEGAGRYAKTVEAEDEARMQAWQAAIKDTIGKRVQAEAGVFRDEMGAYRDGQNRTAAMERAQAGIDARTAATAEKARLDAAEAQAKAAWEVGDVDAYVSIMTEQFSAPEAATRSAVQAQAAKVRRGELIQDRDYQLRARSSAVQEGNLAVSRARLDFERTRPRTTPRTTTRTTADRSDAPRRSDPPPASVAASVQPSAVRVDPAAFQEGGLYYRQLQNQVGRLRRTPAAQRPAVLQEFLDAVDHQVKAGRLGQNVADAYEAAMYDELGY